jgi:hypothetical protein
LAVGLVRGRAAPSLGISSWRVLPLAVLGRLLPVLRRGVLRLRDIAALRRRVLRLRDIAVLRRRVLRLLPVLRLLR